MTELERMLKETLLRMEREMDATLQTHSRTLTEQQRVLEALRQTVQRLQEATGRITDEQRQSQQHLQSLSTVHENSKPLLSRLNGLLSGK